MALDLILQFEKRYPGGTVIQADLQLARSGVPVTILFGPSGSGKTTILRCLAGLESPERGIIRYGDEVWYDMDSRIALSPQERRIGYLFQDYALFPHMKVKQNLEYGLARRNKTQRHQRLAAILDFFELGSLADRYPRQLSGGQMQRVALARAVAPEPRLLLLDEPLSALDDPTRTRLRGDLRTLLLRVGIPTLLVTHDRTEAIALGDQLAVIVDGRVQQIGPVQEVFSRPANHSVASSVGIETVLPGWIIQRSNGLLTVQSGQQRLTAVDTGGFEDSGVYLCIRAEEVALERETPSKTSARNHLPGKITSIATEGPLVRVALDCGLPLTALVTRLSREELGLEQGENVTAVIKATSVHLLPRSETSSPDSA